VLEEIAETKSRKQRVWLSHSSHHLKSLKVNVLLDLRQKQANISEAKSGREQAEETSKQGNTIPVFTVVTIIFVGPSFLREHLRGP
jgi:hypothetical protein